MQKLLLNSVIIISLFLSACIGGGGSGGSGSSGGDASNLIGTWQACVNESATTTSFIQKVVFTADTLVFTYNSFSGFDCNSANAEATKIFNYNYSATASNIETVLQSVTYALHKSSGATTLDIAAANAASLCGFSNWVKDIAKEITNINCFGATFSYGDVETSTYSISGDQLIYESSTYIKVE